MMIESRPKYITVNDSRVIASGVLNAAGVKIDLNEFDFAEFSNTQRKAIVSWDGPKVNSRYGAAVSSRKISEKLIPIDISYAGIVDIEFGSEHRILDEDVLGPGKYNLAVDVYLDIPLKNFGEIPEHIKAATSVL